MPARKEALDHVPGKPRDYVSLPIPIQLCSDPLEGDPSLGEGWRQRGGGRQISSKGAAQMGGESNYRYADDFISLHTVIFSLCPVKQGGQVAVLTFYTNRDGPRQAGRAEGHPVSC